MRTCDSRAQYDLTRVDAQIDGNNLIVASTLTRLDATWAGTALTIYLETDTNVQSGTPITNPLSNQSISADHAIQINVLSLGYPAYTMNLWKPDNSMEGHDSGLNILFSNPSEINSPAKIIATIPLSAIGNPQGPIRLYVVTSYQVNFDYAPYEPLTISSSSAETYELNIIKSGTGEGIVISHLAGINCGSDCTENYLSGTSVILTTTPASDSTFSGWSGACSGTGTCAVTMNTAKSVTATFTPRTGSNKPNDFNGDGMSDILWRHSVTGGNALWLMNGATRTSSANLPLVNMDWRVMPPSSGMLSSSSM